MYCLIYDPGNKQYLEFKDPIKVFQTRDIESVSENLTKAIDATDSQNYVVGFISYEAAPAFDEAFISYEPADSPILCFGVYDTAGIVPQPEITQETSFDKWRPAIDQNLYRASIQKIKNHIAEGDTYQVNYTFKLHSRLTGDPRQMFWKVQQEVQAEYAAYIELESQIICSFSPELFFTWNQGTLTSKPMKGTAPRGLTLEEDEQNSLDLANSVKNQAENIMIVDMIRNDMGRVAKPGSVEVKSLFDVERYPYVLQMTSKVVSQADVSMVRVFESLFPCASITGAPKVRTMKIIKSLESQPRGVYTGTIGYISPKGVARFNVAIRTLVIDKKNGDAEYGVGSGIVWDSETESEYLECLLKSDFLNRRKQDFELIESLLWSKLAGYYLLDSHLERMAGSAEYFNIPFSPRSIRELLTSFHDAIPVSNAKIRLLLDKKGKTRVEWRALAGVKSTNLKVGLAKQSIDSQDLFLYHKTTHRFVYEQAMEGRPDCDDVILWNEKGEITESCRSNVVADIDGELITPLVQCGLLAGTYRGHLIEKGSIREGIITIEDFTRAKRIFTINSVRRWMDAELI